LSHPVAPHPEPPLHIVLSSLQFLFANAGLAAPILVIVAAATIAAVVIAITKSLEPVCLVLCIMHSYLIAVFIYAFTAFEKFGLLHDMIYFPKGMGSKII
jgi:hypothetical protein